jgi:hypothetical protein
MMRAATRCASATDYSFHAMPLFSPPFSPIISSLFIDAARIHLRHAIDDAISIPFFAISPSFIF